MSTWKSITRPVASSRTVRTPAKPSALYVPRSVIGQRGGSCADWSSSSGARMSRLNEIDARSQVLRSSESMVIETPVSS